MDTPPIHYDPHCERCLARVAAHPLWTWITMCHFRCPKRERRQREGMF